MVEVPCRIGVITVSKSARRSDLNKIWFCKWFMFLLAPLSTARGPALVATSKPTTLCADISGFLIILFSPCVSGLHFLLMKQYILNMVGTLLVMKVLCWIHAAL